ncbi:hypothetical protein FRC06_011820 [Ceratobasidium sp. 370]|nr:hypothetical protein FRC06_011820 [Ceratobasidium sp. 370]
MNVGGCLGPDSLASIESNATPVKPCLMLLVADTPSPTCLDSSLPLMNIESAFRNPQTHPNPCAPCSDNKPGYPDLHSLLNDLFRKSYQYDYVSDWSVQRSSNGTNDKSSPRKV